MRKNYNHTIYASYIAYITQAIVNNFAPLLFLTFGTEFGLTLDKITLITTVNFAVQLSVDLISAKVIDKVGYRVSIVFGHVAATAGLIGMAVFPALLGDAYIGLLCAVILYAIGGGIMEVLVSPIVEACPTDNKEAVMSLLHSFYCWGHVAVVLLSTAFFAIFGIGAWRIMAVIWALVPLFNAFFFAKVPLFEVAAGHEKMGIRALLKKGTFWIIVLLMVCAGASEQAMSQWASAFAESALGVSKTLGDLAGPCAFAILMGTARALYGKFSEKLPLIPTMAASAVLCIACYLVAAYTGNPVVGLIACAICGFSVGIFWPGTFSVAAIKIPAGGTAMYALLALAGDVGCGSGPSVVGFVANAMEGSLKWGFRVAILFPILMVFGIFLINRKILCDK